MGKQLVIVESPAKANTIKRYLGPDYEVMASYGHVRDLRPKEGAVDTKNGFAMTYEVVARNAKHVEAIIRATRKADALYLATDLDREGEAISWHIVEILKQRRVLEGKAIHRVVFHEITKRAIQQALENPRTISMDLVSAQQARRALDYLVGFNLSPLLWKKISRGLSAGRVQSPALRMIVERELEIEKFVAKEYWTIEADAKQKEADFTARLSAYRDEKLKQFSINNETDAFEVRDRLNTDANGELVVGEVTKKQRKRNPTAPFITSTLQQESVRKLGFTAQRTMRIAQQLYEGIETGTGTTGLITYMRTDSVTLAQEALTEIRDFVKGRYGADQVPSAPRIYKTQAKNAQEAHEAIRPTSATRLPEELKPHLSAEQFKLYDLIWKRTIASQMVHATIDTVAVELMCGHEGVFRATGSSIASPGFMMVYQEGQDEGKDDTDEKLLPKMATGDRVVLREIRASQHFTDPPPRYTEATLVKTLEEHGIGRPSTYASIISTLEQREYVDLESKRFTPTDVGRIVNRFLTEHFATYVDYAFTARLEDELDSISRGEKQWVPVMEKFWAPFMEQVAEKEGLSRQEVAQARQIGKEPKTGKPVSVRMGRYGPFVQIGATEDDEKPRFYGLRPGQRIETITLAEALELTRLPRELGESADGLPIVIGIGRFGPYVRYGDKFVSIKEDDPYTIELARALELVEEKKKADAERQIKVFEGTELQILNGRYGPYVTNGAKNARVPKDREPRSLSLEEAQTLLANAPPPRRGRKKAGAKAKTKAKAEAKSDVGKSNAKAQSKSKAKTKARKRAKSGLDTGSTAAGGDSVVAGSE